MFGSAAMTDSSATILVVLVVFGVAVGACFAYPQWRVYNARLAGEAERARAEQGRQVLVSQAKAEHEAAVERAKAIEIVGKAAQMYPEYRQQEFIGAFGEALREGTIQQVVYVPTEAMIPIMEANKDRSHE